jgi:hypothetical protein
VFICLLAAVLSRRSHRKPAPKTKTSHSGRTT